jgi:hypothetical protein
MGKLKMHHFALSLIMLFAAPCFAEEEDLNQGGLSADLMSLSYFPHRNKFTVTSYIGSTIADESVNSDGSTTAIGANAFYAIMAYGISESARIGISENLLWDQINTAVANNGLQSVTTSAGFSNPTINLTWRLYDSPRNGLSADLGAGYSPSFGPKVSGSGAQSKTGNNLSGDAESSLTAALFWRWGWNEVEVSGQVTGHSSGRTEGPIQALNFDSDPYVSHQVLFIERIHFGPNFFIQGGATYYAPIKVQLKNDNNADLTLDGRGYTNPRLDIGFRPDPGIAFAVGVAYHDGTSTASGKLGAVTTDNINTSASFTMLHEF